MAYNFLSRDRHLDAFAGREVVYCHMCEHEWYRDEHGLTCPRCQGEATEIVSEGNDPRNIIPDFHRHRHGHLHDTDSDPDEGDIDDHMNYNRPDGISGFIHRGGPESPAPGNPRTRQRANPGDPDDVLRHLHEVMESVSPPAGNPRPRQRNNVGNPDDVVRQFREMMGGFGMGPPQGPAALFANSGGAPRVRMTQWTGPAGYGGSSVTITTSSGQIPMGGQLPLGGGFRASNTAGFDPFQSNPRVFGNIFGQVGVGRAQRNNPDATDGHGDGQDAYADGRGPGPRDARDNRADLQFLLNNLFATILNPNAIRGDAVDSQEALDRIITNLMEQNPHPNAPPPASEETIAKLPRKKLDEEMLGPELKAECTICIDDLTVGDEVLVLPCKHWFHEECVVLWLKEHNTCPVCRAPVEGDANGHEEAGQAGQSSSASSSRAGPSRPGPADRRRSNLRQGGEARLQSIRDLASGPYDRRHLHRRNSNSPPTNSPSGQSSRVRSPSPSASASSRRSNQSEQNRDHGGSGLNAFGWLRDRLNRDRRNNNNHNNNNNN